MRASVRDRFERRRAQLLEVQGCVPVLVHLAHHRSACAWARRSVGCSLSTHSHVGSSRPPPLLYPPPSTHTHVHVVSSHDVQPKHQLLHTRLRACTQGRIQAARRRTRLVARASTLAHLGAVHTLVTLVQDEVGGLVVPPQRALCACVWGGAARVSGGGAHERAPRRRRQSRASHPAIDPPQSACRHW